MSGIRSQNGAGFLTVGLWFHGWEDGQSQREGGRQRDGMGGVGGVVD